MKTKKIFVLTVLISTFIVSCSVFKQITNISRLKFKLNSVSNFRLSGIDISNYTSYKEFSVLEAAQLLNSFKKSSFFVSFNLNVEAYNPNDGGGGYPRQDLDIVDFKWRLSLDGVETLSGNIDRPISVPGTGETTIFPIRIEFDLYKFFNDKGFDGLINLALKLGGKRSDLSLIVLKAKPTIQTPFGKITYPDEIKITHKEFN